MELVGPTIGGSADHPYEAHYPPMLCGFKKHAPKQVSTIGWRVCFLWTAHKLSTWINRPTHHIWSIEVAAPPHTHSRRRNKAPHQRGAPIIGRSADPLGDHPTHFFTPPPFGFPHANKHNIIWSQPCNLRQSDPRDARMITWIHGPTSNYYK